MRNDYIVRAQKFIQEIAYYLEGADSIRSYDWAVTAFNTDHHRAVKMAHGLTRIALITSDYVVKIDYDPVKIATFGGCKNEMKIYELAEHDNISYLFAKITPYEYNGMTYYIMPRIRNIGQSEDDAWEYMTEDESDWCMEHGLFDLHSHNYGWKDAHIVLIDYGAHE